MPTTPRTILDRIRQDLSLADARTARHHLATGLGVKRRQLYRKLAKPVTSLSISEINVIAGVLGITLTELLTDAKPLPKPVTLQNPPTYEPDTAPQQPATCE